MKITNVVISCYLGCSINLKHLCKCLCNIKYQPWKMNCLVYNHHSIRKTALLYPSGRIHVTGCESVAHAKKCLRQYARIIQRKGYNVKMCDIKITTISLTHKISNMKFEKIIEMFKCTYEPEIFSGARMWVQKNQFYHLLLRSN